ncbi:hypothetical protein phiAS5_ORF0091 [Aeromonas phage phiAS5]|uniref:Uncharacterized protein n=1 Tax=Aeromonas phage phiAS5 TaxID=879630 RepID=E1A2I8_9CAUD|nr:hypothetical protein phiAS5_ORF0091 [Aeromonas phage phiAS5]ADM79934.1 hypothetical protein phiAS5_ORF0091 [Aeromonas phage phiAS5]BES53295.1 hypothetical protein [Aeromonas phage phiWae14]
MIVDIKNAESIIHVIGQVRWHENQGSTLWNNAANEIFHMGMLSDRVLKPFVELTKKMGTTLMGDSTSRVNIDDMFVPFILNAYRFLEQAK